MIKVDLITGFLGAGKTTFIKKYAKYMMDCGYHICILENDYGAVNVDMMMLQDLESDRCELEMVSGGCDPDCHKRRFKTKLISMGMCGYDRVLIEPSGIFDVDDPFSIHSSIAAATACTSGCPDFIYSLIAAINTEYSYSKGQRSMIPLPLP